MRVLLIFFMLAQVSVFAQQKQVLSAKEFKAKLKDPAIVLIDVRTPQEFQESHIEKAINKNLRDKDFDSYCAKLEKGKTYLVYCLAGARSHTAAENMRKKGLTVFELEDGIEGWQDAKLPVVK